MNNFLNEKLQVWGFEENLIVFRDGSLGAAFELGTLDVSCQDDESLNALSQRVCDFVNGLPQGLSLQFMQEITSGNEKTIQEHSLTLKESASELTKEITTSRAKTLKSADEEGLIPKQNLYLFLRNPLKEALISKKKIFSFRKKQNVVLPDIKLKFEIENFRRKARDLQKGLELVGVSSRELTQQEIFSMLYKQWNPNGLSAPENINADDIRDQILLTDAVVGTQGFTLGDIHHRVISLKLLPDVTFATMAETLKDLPFESRLFLTIEVLDQAKEISTLQLQRRIAFSMVSHRKGVADLESEAKLRDIEALLAETITGQEKVFKMGVNILLRSPSENELQDQISMTLQKIRELSGAEGMQETIAAFEIFSEFALPNANVKERSIKVNTSVLSDFLPIYGLWKGHSSPRVLLKNRFDSLVSFDPFSSDMTNANQIISGGSGSGKSYLMNLVISQMLKETPKIFILDIGGSYKKTCENLDGQYVPLGIDSGLSINPFELSSADPAAKDQKIKYLVSLVELMTKENESKSLGRLEKAELENAILQTYEEKKEPCLSDLKEILVNHQDSSLKRIGRILATWCGDTPYGKFVDRPTNIKLSSQIVCFDLKGMEAQPELQCVCLFLIADLIWREIQKDRTTMKFVIFDECWKLMESNADLIAELYRTARKYFCSVIGISQTMDDFAKSKIASAIMPNSSIKWILKQKGANLQNLKESLQLNDREISLITSLQSEKGRYSEAFLMCEDKRQVVRIEATPLEYWLATTDPKDIFLLQEIKKENPNFSEFQALKFASQRYPNGAFNQGV